MPYDLVRSQIRRTHNTTNGKRAIMVKRIVIGGAAAIAVLAVSAISANAQKLPGRKACQAGMSFSQCVSRCIELGGQGKQSPAAKCSKRCAKKGCI
jgi:hypothetical protein